MTQECELEQHEEEQEQKRELSSMKRKHQLTQEQQVGQRQKLQWPLKNERPGHILRGRHML
jgi:hypothetical protein